MTERRAEIAGGGIAGLFTALALARRGWRVRVHERSSEIREIGAGIYLSVDALNLFDRYAIADLILSRASPLIASERRERDGRLIQRRENGPDSRRVVLQRADLIQSLAQAARVAGVDIHTNSQVSSIRPDGTMTFSDGETVEANLIVVADGFRSRLRRQLQLTVTQAERKSGATRMLIPQGEPEAEGVAREYWSGSRRVGIAPSGPGITYVYLSCLHRDARGAAVPIDIESWQQHFPVLDGFLERFRAPYEATRHAYPFVHARPWSRGRAAIVGDAAHALPPTLGQGAVLAMVNGDALAAMMDRESDVEAGLAVWEAERRVPTDRIQRSSVRIDTLTTGYPRALASLRRVALRQLGWKA